MAVRTYILLLCLSFLIAVGALFGVNTFFSERLLSDVTLPKIDEILRQKYEYGLKGVIDVQAQNLGALATDVKDVRELYAMIERETDGQRFFPGNEGYYFTYDISGVRVNVPINKSANGKNLIDLKDASGVPFVRKFVEQAQKGGGYVLYQFEKEGAGVQPKLSYVRMIPGTDVLIGAGVYIDGVQTEKKAFYQLMIDEGHQAFWYQAWVGLGILCFIGVCAWLVTRRICVPLRHLTEGTSAIAAGHLNTVLTLEPGTPDEICTMHDSVSTMITNLRAEMDAVAAKSREAAQAEEQARRALNDAEQARQQAECARQDGMVAAAGRLEKVVAIVGSASSELAAHIEQSERGSTEQASRMIETATAMEEMNATVMEVAKNAGAASEVSAATRQKAEAGAGIVRKAVASIQIVQTQSLKLKDDMATLSTHAQAINQIMGVISDIADQTNLLALNAAIEAARAGDAGRGFAVVADEVRKLAEKTMASTTDVGNAIKAIQHSANESMKQVDMAVQSIDEATDFAAQSGTALQEIVSMVDNTADQVRAIATAAEEQSASSEAINQSITQVNTIAADTAQAMGEAARAVSELAEQTHALTRLIAEMSGNKG